MKVFKIKFLYRFAIQILGGCNIVILMQLNFAAQAIEALDKPYINQFKFSEESEILKEDSLDKIKVIFPEKKSILVGGPDNFIPGKELRLDFELNDFIVDPNKILGWPTLGQDQRKKLEEEHRKILDKIEIENAKIKYKLEQEKIKLETKLKLFEIDEENRKIKEDLENKYENQKKQEKEEIKKRKYEKTLKEEELRAKKKEEKLKKIKEKAEKKEEKIRKNKEKAEKRKNKSKRESKKEIIKLKRIETSFGRISNNSGQLNQLIDGTLYFDLFNGDKLSVNTGFTNYVQSGFDSIENIPVKLSWERNIGKFTITVNTGFDWFSRVSPAPSLKITASRPVSIPKKLGESILLSGELDYGPYKFNAETIQNEIQYLRLRGNLFWQINSDTSIFSIAHYGILNDGNQEFQIFSRVEHKLGKFSVAGNLFVWRFQKDLSSTSGYFSPQDFVVANAEIAWKDKIAKFLTCRLATSFGQQYSQGIASNAFSFQSLCTIPISKKINLDLGYNFSNISKRFTLVNDSTFTNTFTGQLSIDF